MRRAFLLALLFVSACSPLAPTSYGTFATADSYANDTRLDVAETGALPADSAWVRIDGICAFYASKTTERGEGTLCFPTGLTRPVETGTLVVPDAECGR